MKQMKTSKLSIVCYGELVIDFFGTLVDRFSPKFGGAPGNTAVGLAKLGQKNLRFVGKVGKDFFGDFLDNTLQSYGIETEDLLHDPKNKTTLAFVARGKNGARDFSFYPGAHDQIKPTEVRSISFKDARILQFGSLTQTNLDSQKATAYLLAKARKEKAYISYDPNVRLPLWESPALLKKTVLATIPAVDMLKVNEEELVFFTGTKSPKLGAKKLWKKNLQLLLITLGDKGAYWKTPTGEGIIPTMRIKPIDTTGAGDAFNAGLLSRLHPHVNNGVLELDNEKIKVAVSFANHVASLSTLKRGAIEALPTVQDVAYLND